MNTKHTPEPWNYSLGNVIERRADIERAFACVNACASMADPASEIARLKSERDELVAALKRALAVIVSAQQIACSKPIAANPLVMEMQTCGGAVLAAQQAIARAEGRVSE